jgi:hypothetical protein
MEIMKIDNEIERIEKNRINRSIEDKRKRDDRKSMIEIERTVKIKWRLDIKLT